MDHHDHASSCHCSHDTRTVEKNHQVSAPQSDYMVSELLIPEMDCPTEMDLITKKLDKHSGISELRFNLVDRSVILTHAPNSIDEIIHSIKSLGMNPVLKQGAAVTQHRTMPFLSIASAVALALLAEFTHWFEGPMWIVIILSLSAIALTGLSTYKKGWIALKHLTLNINALMSIAVTGALALQQWPEAAMVMALFALAERLESRALEKVKDSIHTLNTLVPTRVTRIDTEGGYTSVDIESVNIGDHVLVSAGERVPLDGVIRSGHTTLNQAAMTGESIPVEKSIGDEVFAGSLNELGSITLEVSSTAQHSSIAKIIQTIQDAQSARAPTQRIVDKFAKIYTPIVCLIALSTAVIPPLLMGSLWTDSIYRGLVLLIIACPCALIISTPVTIISGITAAARQGLLIKGGVYLEQARQLRFIAFDKTGTLTEGQPQVQDYQILTPETATPVLRIARSLAGISKHPLSRCITMHKDIQCLAPLPVNASNTIVGQGVSAQIEQTTYLLGSVRLLKDHGINLPDALLDLITHHQQQGHTLSLLSDDTEVLALFAMADTVKESSRTALNSLDTEGMTTLMLTGDNRDVAQAIAKELNIAEVYSELLPEDKLRIISEHADQGMIAMIGDGINDAPALARADIGIAMGITGSDTATETADITLMNDDLRLIPKLIQLSEKTHRILVQNISVTLLIKLAFVTLSVFGMSDMWMAIFADVGASLIVIANGLRVMTSSKT